MNASIPEAPERNAGLRRRPALYYTLAACLLAMILAPGSTPSAVSAQGPVNGLLDQVAFDQKLGGAIPLDLPLRDERNQNVRLGDYFDGRPVILTLNYFHCPNLCPLVLDSLVGTMADLDLNLGEQFQVVTVSIDPRETAVMAAGKKTLYTGRYARTEGERQGAIAGWHFLTGDAGALAQLTAAVGFHYAFDAAQDEFAHPTGLIVLTGEGTIARYLYGLDFPARDLRLALVEASANHIGTLTDQVLLACYHYDPQTGRYSLMALDATRAGGAATIVLLGGWLLYLFRQEGRRAKEPRV